MNFTPGKSEHREGEFEFKARVAEDRLKYYERELNYSWRLLRATNQTNQQLEKKVEALEKEKQELLAQLYSLAFPTIP